MLDELEQVDCAVEEGGLKGGFGVGVELQVLGFQGLDGGDVPGYVDECDDVNGELAQDGADDVRIEDVGLGAFFGESFDRLRMGVVSIYVC